MSFVKRVAAASKVEGGHVQKVLQALTEVLKEDLQEKSKVRITPAIKATEMNRRVRGNTNWSAEVKPVDCSTPATAG